MCNSSKRSCLISQLSKCLSNFPHLFGFKVSFWTLTFLRILETLDELAVPFRVSSFKLLSSNRDVLRSEKPRKSPDSSKFLTFATSRRMVRSSFLVHLFWPISLFLMHTVLKHFPALFRNFFCFLKSWTRNFVFFIYSLELMMVDRQFLQTAVEAFNEAWSRWEKISVCNSSGKYSICVWKISDFNFGIFFEKIIVLTVLLNSRFPFNFSTKISINLDNSQFFSKKKNSKI